MKWLYMILGSAAALLLMFFIVDGNGLLGGLNQPVNQMINGMPDTGCKIDSDCMVKYADCRACCPEAVNIGWKPLDWQPTCPFIKGIVCEPCMYKEPRCQQGNCVLVEPQYSEGEIFALDLPQ